VTWPCGEVTGSERESLSNEGQRSATFAGIVRTRGGDAFKPGTIRAYSQALRLRVYPAVADSPFYRVRRVHLQELVDKLIANGVAPATINTSIGVLGAIYGRAVHRDELEVSPTLGVKVPSARNGRERFATPSEATLLLAAVPDRDRAVWATAMYAGLRRGELMALRWADVDFKAGTVHVARSWDLEHGPGDTKNRNRRKVPITACSASTSPPNGCGRSRAPNSASGSTLAVHSAPTGSKSAPTRLGRARTSSV
jgi:integrase